MPTLAKSSWLYLVVKLSKNLITIMIIVKYNPFKNFEIWMKANNDNSKTKKWRFRRRHWKRIVTRYCSMVCPSVCSSDTLVQPAKAVGRNEMPFGRDTRVIPSNTALTRGPEPPVCRDGTYCQITLVPVLINIPVNIIFYKVIQLHKPRQVG